MNKYSDKEYKVIQKVFCPYFKETITFNKKGLRHLKYKSERHKRNSKDAEFRLKNIRFAKIILEKTHTLQEKYSDSVFVKTKSNNKKEMVLKNCNYYCFIAIIKNQTTNQDNRFKVIVRQTQGGEKHFWSIIPSFQKQIK